MPWQECNLMDERLKFIAGLLEGEKMAVLCRRFGISRKTGYKILDRYNSCGVEGLTDRSRRPYRHANQLPVQIETLIVRSKQERPHWRAPKIRERLARLYTPGVVSTQTISVRAGGGTTSIAFNGAPGTRFLGGAQAATLLIEEISG
jgi:putative transposase